MTAVTYGILMMPATRARKYPAPVTKINATRLVSFDLSSSLIEENPKNPEISPLYGDFEGFPPMLIQVGSEEMLYSDSEAVAAKAKEAGVKVKFSVYEGMFHVFQLSAMLMPESKKAWFEVRRFMDEITGQGSSEGETDEMSETEESGDEG